MPSVAAELRKFRSDCFWSVAILEHYIESGLFSNQGKLPNNFDKTMPNELKPSALKIFQDEYLMDFMTPGEVEGERVMEDKIVGDIKRIFHQQHRQSNGCCHLSYNPRTAKRNEGHTTRPRRAGKTSLTVYRYGR
jgi:hypothetical protein